MSQIHLTEEQAQKLQELLLKWEADAETLFKHSQVSSETLANVAHEKETAAQQIREILGSSLPAVAPSRSG